MSGSLRLKLQWEIQPKEMGGGEDNVDLRDLNLLIHDA